MSRILIVDDEPLARRRLALLLGELGVAPDRVASADGVAAAHAQIAGEAIDIVLLDVRMRDGTGFDLLRQLPGDAAPAIIFVTAFDDFAVRAFEVAAADYLVKPVSVERLGLALERAQHLLAARPPGERRAALARIAEVDAPDAQTAAAHGLETEFWIRRAGGDFVRVEVTTIDYAVVEEDYVRIVAGGRNYLLRESIRGLLARLDPDTFIQVHRSALVRTTEIAEVGRARFGRAEVVLRGGQRLPLGRVHGKAVQKLVRRGG